MNVLSKLEGMKLRTFTIAGLTTDIREWLELGVVRVRARIFVEDILGRSIEFADDLSARIFVKRLCVELSRSNWVVNAIDIDAVIADCWSCVNEYVTDSKWDFLRSELANEPEVKVVVKETKGQTVIRWYREMIIDQGLDIKLLKDRMMDELGMGKAGVQTYLHKTRRELAI